MSPQQQRQPSGNDAPLRPRDRHPSCPQCSRPMTVKQVTPVLFATTVDDVIFGCEECGTELKRAVKRP